MTLSLARGVFVAAAEPAGDAAGEVAGAAELVDTVWLSLAQAPKQMVDRTRTASDADRDTSRSIFLPFENRD